MKSKSSNQSSNTQNNRNIKNKLHKLFFPSNKKALNQFADKFQDHYYTNSHQIDKFKIPIHGDLNFGKARPVFYVEFGGYYLKIAKIQIIDEKNFEVTEEISKSYSKNKIMNVEEFLSEVSTILNFEKLSKYKPFNLVINLPFSIKSTLNEICEIDSTITHVGKNINSEELIDKEIIPKLKKILKKYRFRKALVNSVNEVILNNLSTLAYCKASDITPDKIISIHHGAGINLSTVNLLNKDIIIENYNPGKIKNIPAGLSLRKIDTFDELVSGNAINRVFINVISLLNKANLIEFNEEIEKVIQLENNTENLDKTFQYNINPIFKDKIYNDIWRTASRYISLIIFTLIKTIVNFHLSNSENKQTIVFNGEGAIFQKCEVYQAKFKTKMKKYLFDKKHRLNFLTINPPKVTLSGACILNSIMLQYKDAKYPKPKRFKRFPSLRRKKQQPKA